MEAKLALILTNSLFQYSRGLIYIEHIVMDDDFDYAVSFKINNVEVNWMITFPNLGSWQILSLIKDNVQQITLVSNTKDPSRCKTIDTLKF